MKHIYKFGPDKAEGDISMKKLLGGKGAGLAEMVNLGFPVPPGFTITSDVCNEYHSIPKLDSQLAFLETLVDMYVMPAYEELSEEMEYTPLVSVRSGAADSMPGMMDTILNVGLTEDTLDYWKSEIGELAALDSYRRLIQMYGTTVCGQAYSRFEDQMRSVKQYKFGLDERPVHDCDLTVKHLEKLIGWYKHIIEHEVPDCFPENNFRDQLIGSIGAVFESWNNPRAIHYRSLNNIDPDMGTAVNVQAMVFGNKNAKSCSGVVFTRNPDTGVREMFGDFLANAQGEDVVAGIRPTSPFSELKKFSKKIFQDLIKIAERLEYHHKDMRDIEFTVEDGKLYILQDRTGLRSAEAAFRIAVEQQQEGIITKKQALKRVSSKQYVALKKPMIDPDFKDEPNGKGIAAGGGVVSGLVVFTSEDAVATFEPTILLTQETTPEDIEGMAAAVGILTATGGITSHAAVVARSMNKSCVVGCVELEYQTPNQWILNGDLINIGDTISIDGSTGNIWINVAVPLLTPDHNQYAEKIVNWATSSEAYVQRIMAATDMTEHDMADKVYFDTLAVEDEEFGLQKVLEYMAGSPVAEIYLDLRTKYNYMESADSLLWEIFEAPDAMSVILENKLDVIQSNQWSSELKSKTTLFLPSNTPKHRVAELVNHDWKIVTEVGNLEELLNSQGMINLTDDFEKSVGGASNMKRLLDVFADAGKPITCVLKAVSKTRHLFDLLG